MTRGKLQLVYTRPDGGKEVAQLDGGDNIVGRKHWPSLSRQNLISRKQLRLVVDEVTHGASVTLVSTVNKSYVERRAAGQLIELTTHVPVELSQGDRIHLLMRKPIVTVAWSDGGPSRGVEERKAGRSHAQDHDADDGVEDDRPMCKFGLECFRVNPLHLKQFRHPRGHKPGGGGKRRRDDRTDSVRGPPYKRRGTSADKAPPSHKGTDLSAPGRRGGGGGSGGGGGTSSSPGTGGPTTAQRLWFSSDGDRDGVEDADGKGDDGEADPEPALPTSPPALAWGDSEDAGRRASMSSAIGADAFANSTQALRLGQSASQGSLGLGASASQGADSQVSSTGGRTGGGGGGGSGGGSGGRAGPGTPAANSVARSTSAQSSAVAPPAGAGTLAIPLISAGAEFGYPAKKTASVGFECARAFLERHKNPYLRVMFVEDVGTAAADAFQDLVDAKREADADARAEADAAGRDFTGSSWDSDGRLSFSYGDIANPISLPHKCVAVVNRCNWRFVPHGADKVNKAIHAAMGGELQRLSQSLHHTAKPGHAYPVEVPKASTFRSVDGVRWVINVLGPNMNPVRNDCLKHQPEKAAKVLRQAYDSVFVAFWELVKRRIGGDAAAGDVTDTAAGGGTAAAGAGSGAGAGAAGIRAAPSPAHTTAKRGAGKSSWRDKLADYAIHPEKHADAIFAEDARCVVIHDKYKKSTEHLLLIPKPNYLDVGTVKDLRAAHLAKLRKLHAYATTVAKQAAKEYREANPRTPPLQMKCGYHSVPSMRPLHIHIMSTDMRAPAMKNKKHYLSFTTSFFLDLKRVERSLEWDGSVSVDRSVSEKLLKGPLVCHRCRATQRNMPKLKAHLEECDG